MDFIAQNPLSLFLFTSNFCVSSAWLGPVCLPLAPTPELKVVQGWALKKLCLRGATII